MRVATGAIQSKTRRVLVIIPLLITVFLVLTWARAFYGSWKAYGTGEEMVKKKELIRAITFFDRSIHWYTPLNPYVEKSAQRLWEIGEEAEKQGDLTTALIAFRTLRGGFYSARHFTLPGKDWIEKCDARINSLTLTKSDNEMKGDKRRQEIPLQAPRDPSPDVFWTVVLETGFLGWVGSMIALILTWRFSNEDWRKKSPKASMWAVLALGFFALWIVGMFKA